MSHIPNSILIFAAGFGTRMGALTTHMPKPLIPVAGRPMIDHAISITRDAGISNLTTNLHYKHDMLTSHLSGQGIHFSIENPDILDTGGGLRQALKFTGIDPVFTLNPDAVWLGANPLTLLKQAWNPDQMDALLVLIPPANAMGHGGKGDFKINPNSTLTRGPGLIYSGAQIVKTRLLHQIDQTSFSLNLLWDFIGEKERLFGLPYTGKWCDVGTPQGIVTAEKMLEGSNV